MVLIITATLVVLSVGVVLFLTRKKETPIAYTSSIVSSPILIICGDCSGDEHRPIKTSLNVQGACSVCDGRSWILAADVGHYKKQDIFTRAAFLRQLDEVNETYENRIIN